MARKVKFALEMADGTKVRNSLEELREHFDMESIISYYLSGKLLEWLEDRYYDDEAAKIEELDKDSPNLNAQLCAIIGVDASDFDALDVEALERLNEKKVYLRQKTSDESIIENAMITAITQQDLADLLDLESPIIYLCGEKFNIPIRMEHKKYIGVLGTPKVEIRANSIDDLSKRDIIFENVILPWEKNTSSNQQTIPTIPLPATDTSTPIASTEELFELFQSIFIQGYGSKEPEIFEYVQGFGIYNLHDKVTPAKEKLAIKMICKNKFEKKDLVKGFMTEDFTSGCIFTTSAICLYDKNPFTVDGIKKETSYILPYQNIASASAELVMPDDVKKDRSKQFNWKSPLFSDVRPKNRLIIQLKDGSKISTPVSIWGDLNLWENSSLLANFLTAIINL